MSAANHIVLIAGMGTSLAVRRRWYRAVIIISGLKCVRFCGSVRVVDEGLLSVRKIRHGNVGEGGD